MFMDSMCDICKCSLGIKCENSHMGTDHLCEAWGLLSYCVRSTKLFQHVYFKSFFFLFLFSWLAEKFHMVSTMKHSSTGISVTADMMHDMMAYFSYFYSHIPLYIHIPLICIFSFVLLTSTLERKKAETVSGTGSTSQIETNHTINK